MVGRGAADEGGSAARPAPRAPPGERVVPGTLSVRLGTAGGVFSRDARHEGRLSGRARERSGRHLRERGGDDRIGMALKPRSHARKRAPAAAPGRAGIHASPVFVVTLGLLFALPVLFLPWVLVDEFEFVKVSLLVTGALVLAGWWIAAESSRIGSAGFLGWLKHVPGRVAAAVRRDPLGGAVALFVLSAAA